MVIYPGTLSGGLTEDDMSQRKKAPGKGAGTLKTIQRREANNDS